MEREGVCMRLELIVIKEFNQKSRYKRSLIRVEGDIVNGETNKMNKLNKRQIKIMMFLICIYIYVLLYLIFQYQ